MIFSVFIILFFIILIALNIFFAIRRKNLMSYMLAGANLISSAAAFFMSKGICAGLSGKAVSIITKHLSSSYKNYNGIEVLKTTGIYNITYTFSRMFLSIGCFIVLYVLLYSILHIPVKIISKNFNNTGRKTCAVIVGILSAIIMFFVLITPICALCHYMNTDTIDSKSYKKSYGAAVDDIYSNPFIKIFEKPGTGFADALTGFEHDGKKYAPFSEASTIIKLVYGCSDLTSENVSAHTLTNSSANVKEAFSDSSLIPPAVLTISSTATSEWLAGNDFLKIDLKLNSSRTGAILKSTIKLVNEWDIQDVNDMFETMVDFMCLAGSKNLFHDTSADNLLAAFSDNDFADDMLMTFFTNDNLKEIVPYITYSGIGVAFDTIGISLPDEDSINVDLSNMTEDDIHNEASIISSVAGAVYDIKTANNSLSISKMSLSQITDLTIALSGLSDSYFLKDFAVVIVNDFLKKAGITNTMGNIFSDIFQWLQ